MYGLYGLKHHTVEISGDVTDPDGRTDGQTTRKDRATQLLICEALSFAIGRIGGKYGGVGKNREEWKKYGRVGENREEQGERGRRREQVALLLGNLRLRCNL